MRRLGLGVVTAVLLLAVCAQAGVILQVNAVSHRGFISVAIIASPQQNDVTLYERVAGELREVAHPAAIQGDSPQFGPVSYAPLPDVLRWSCSRRVRTLVAIARSADGSSSQTEYQVRTPSCANRLSLSVRPGAATVRDTWEAGKLSTRVCGPRKCLRFDLGPRRESLTRRMALRRGDEVTLYAPFARVTQTVGARPSGGSTILVTGDSMMQSLDTVLEDRLSRTANVASDVQPGSALSSDFVVDWPELARRHVRRFHPHATVLFLGTNDAYDMDGVKCCGPDWARIYEQRARELMRIYAQDGAGRVIWLTVPASKDPRRNPSGFAINGALARAAASVDGVSLVPADRIFTPGGTYRDTMPYRGRTVRVREDDGIHLSLAGGRIAADYVIAELKRDGVL